MKRVVITGIGAITPIGSGREGLWKGVLQGRSAVRRVTRFDPSPFRSQVAAEVEGFDALDHMEAQRARRLDRYSQFAIAAARQAVADAGILDVQTANTGNPKSKIQNPKSEEVGVYLGSALGGLSFAEEQHARFVESGLRAVNNILALTVFGSASSCNVAMEMGLYGPNQTNANSCASGAVAIGEAFKLIQRGGATVMLAGGVEAPLAPLTFGSFDLIRALSSNSNDNPGLASRPFDAQRDGFVMSEGSAILVLEELGHAVQRGAQVYAEVVGYATTTDAYHMTAPRPDGRQAIRAMKEALADARLLPEEIEYISAHASATPLNDKTETMAIKAVLGDYAYRVPISGTKAMHGHALGASGAFEIAISCLAMRHRYLPPTINLYDPDPECDLDYIPHVGRERRVRTVLSNSFGFGGINSCLVLKEGEGVG